MADKRTYDLDAITTVAETYVYPVDAGSAGVIAEAKKITHATKRDQLKPLVSDFTMTSSSGSITSTGGGYYAKKATYLAGTSPTVIGYVSAYFILSSGGTSDPIITANFSIGGAQSSGIMQVIIAKGTASEQITFAEITSVTPLTFKIHGTFGAGDITVHLSGQIF